MKEEKTDYFSRLNFNEKYFEMHLTRDMIEEVVEQISGIKGANIEVNDNAGKIKGPARRGPTRPDVQQLQF